jgi:hypothetical protein
MRGLKGCLALKFWILPVAQTVQDDEKTSGGGHMENGFSVHGLPFSTAAGQLFVVSYCLFVGRQFDLG